METALRSRLTGVCPRVHWGIRPQSGALPAIVLTIASDVRTQHMDGFDGYQAKRVQVDCYATTYAEAAALRESVIAAIVPAATAGGVNFLRGFVNNTMTRGEDTTTGYEHRQMLDITIWHD
jgi:hypothetical protein